jgi:hypothetical protein
VDNWHLSPSDLARTSERDTIFVEPELLQGHRRRTLGRRLARRLSRRLAALPRAVGAAAIRVFQLYREGMREDLILYAATMNYMHPELMCLLPKDLGRSGLRSRLYRVERFEEVDDLVARVNDMMEHNAPRQGGPARGE